jgi:hypothetical protein
MRFVVPLLAGVMSFFVGQELCQYMWYTSALRAAQQVPQGPWDSSPHLQAVREAAQSGLREGKFAAIPAYLVSTATLKSGVLTSLAAGLLAGAFCAAIIGYFRI